MGARPKPAHRLKAMGCCERPSPGSVKFSRGFLPRRLILPLQILALAGFGASGLFLLLAKAPLTATYLLLIAVQMALSFTVLAECRRSNRFYKQQDRAARQHCDLP